MSLPLSFRGGADFDAGPAPALIVVWDHARRGLLLRGEEVAVFATRGEALAAVVEAKGHRYTDVPSPAPGPGGWRWSS